MKYLENTKKIIITTLMTLLLFGCAPDDVVNVTIEGVDGTTVYGSVPTIVLNYRASYNDAVSQSRQNDFASFIENQLVVTLNGSNVTKYFQLNAGNAVLVDKAGFSEVLFQGKNVLAVSNSADEDNSYGKVPRIISTAIIRFSDGKAQLSVFEVDPVRGTNTIDVNGVVKSEHRIQMFTINQVSITPDNEGYFEVNLPRASFYAIEIHTANGAVTRKLYNQRGTFSRPAIQVKINEEIMNQDSFKVLFNELLTMPGPLDIPPEIARFINPIEMTVFGLIHISASAKSIQTRGGEWRYFRFVPPDIPDTAEMEIGMTTFNTDIIVDACISVLIINICLSDVKIIAPLIHIDTVARARADEFGRLYVGLKDLQLDIVNGTVRLGNFLDFIIQFLDPIISFFIDMFEGVISDIIELKVGDLLAYIFNDIVLGGFFVTDLVNADIKLTWLNTDDGNLHIRIRGSAKSTAAFVDALGANATVAAGPYSYGQEDGYNGSFNPDDLDSDADSVDPETADKEREIIYETDTIVYNGTVHTVTVAKYADDGSPVTSGGYPEFPHRPFTEPVAQTYVSPIFSSVNTAVKSSIGVPGGFNIGIAISADFINQIALALQEIGLLSFSIYVSGPTLQNPIPTLKHIEIGSSILEPIGTVPGDIRIRVKSLAPIELNFAGGNGLVANTIIPSVKVKIERKDRVLWDPLLEFVLHINAAANLRMSGGAIYLKILTDTLDYKVVDLEVFGTDIIPEDLINLVLPFFQPVVVSVIEEVPLIGFNIPLVGGLLKSSSLYAGGPGNKHVHVSVYVELADFLRQFLGL